MKRVVVADDEPDILESTELVLLADGFEVATVATVEHILPTLRRFRPEILLQDINMPRIDLGVLVQAIRAEPGLDGVRVLLFSASNTIEETAQLVGADGFIQKPFDALNIKGVLERALAKPALAAQP